MVLVNICKHPEAKITPENGRGRSTVCNITVMPASQEEFALS